MRYSINCACGDKVTVEASDYEAAVGKMVIAMGAHFSSKNHPDVSLETTPEEKRNMVLEQMMNDE